MSELDRDHNGDADPGTEELPVLSINDSNRLLLFAIATTNLLRNEAERNIEWINRCGKDHTTVRKTKNK
jgi:hypothetical protein